MPKYTLIKNNLDENIIIQENEDGTIWSFGEWPGNSQYEAYLATLPSNSVGIGNAPAAPTA